MLNSKRDFIKQTNIIFTAFIFTSFVLAVIFFNLLKIHDYFFPDLNWEKISEPFLDNYKGGVFPKSHENFAFVSSLLLLPLMSISTLIFFRQIMMRWQKSTIVMSIILILIILLAMSELSKGSMFVNNLIHNIYDNKHLIQIEVMFSFFLGYLMMREDIQVWLTQKKLNVFFILVSGVLIGIQTITFRIVNVNFAQNTNNWTVEFGAIFYSATQVYAGKTLLADLPSQYGLYAEMLLPIFKVIGFNVFKYTLVLSAIQMIALACIFYVLKKILHNPILWLLAVCNLTLVTGFLWFFIYNYFAIWYPYYQYFPVRFFFPALSLLLQFWFIHHKNYSAIILIAITAALSILWNMESGMACFGAFLGILLSYIFFPSELIARKRALFWTGGYLLLCSASVSLFLTYLQLKSDTPIDFGSFLKYQSLFYKTGFMMLPLPRTPNMWQLICGLYLFGMTYSIYFFINKKRTVFVEMLFFTCLLGFGLFLYYEGRAHDNLLVLVSWPAFMVAFMLIDRLFIFIQRRQLPKFYGLLAMPIIIFALLNASELALAMPFMVKNSYYYVQRLIHPENNEISRNIAFIKQHIYKNEPTVILATNQAVYYGELGLASAISGPGLVEIILKADLMRLKKQLSTLNSFFYQPSTSQYFLQDYQDVIKGFVPIAKSPDGMIFYQRKA